MTWTLHFRGRTSAALHTFSAAFPTRRQCFEGRDCGPGPRAPEEAMWSAFSHTLWHGFAHSSWHFGGKDLASSSPSRKAATLASWDVRDPLAESFPATSPQKASGQGRFLLVCTLFPPCISFLLNLRNGCTAKWPPASTDIARGLPGTPAGWALVWHCLAAETKPVKEPSSSSSACSRGAS